MHLKVRFSTSADGFRISPTWLDASLWYGFVYVSYLAAVDSIYVHWWDETGDADTRVVGVLRAGQTWQAVSPRS